MQLLRSTLLVLTALAFPTFASATPMDLFQLTGNGLTLTFTAAASPAPASSDATLGFFLGSVPLTANGKKYTAQPAAFYVDDVGGGFALLNDDDLIQYFAFGGEQLFTGAVSAPTFEIGTFALQAVYCPGSDPDGPPVDCVLPTYNLAVSSVAAVTPEPSSLGLLATGCLGLGGILRRRLRG